MDKYTLDLLEAACRGNVDAFEHIYQLYKDKIYAISLSTLKNRQDAEDATQQTFIKVYEKLSELENAHAFNTWIQRIAINESNMILRKRKGDVSIDDDENGALAERIEDDFMLPQEYAERDDLSRRLREIIDELPPVQRQALVLQMYSNLSMAEIAQVMDCSENTVKSRIRYAKAYIKTEIEERERKSGEKFYGAVLLPFGSLFTGLVRSQSMSPAVVARIWGAVSQHIAGAVAAAGGSAAVGSAAGAAGSVAAKTGMALGAKIAIGAVLGAAVIGGAVFGITKIVSANNDTVKPTEAITETATEVVTETVTEAVTEAPAEADYSAVYSDYIQVLEGNQSGILEYEEEPNQYIDRGIEVRSIAFADIMGDPAPEMIFIAKQGEGTAEPLNIVSFKDGHAYFALTDNNFATKVSKGPGYYLFTDGSTLYASTANGGQYTDDYHFYRFDPASDGTVTKTEVLYGLYTDNDQPDDEYHTPTPSSARVNGEETDLSSFEAAREKLLASAKHLLMSYTDSASIDPRSQERFADMKNEAMNYAEAISYLRGNITPTEANNNNEAQPTDYSAIAGSYTEAHFEGLRSIKIENDGSFIFSVYQMGNPEPQTINGHCTDITRDNKWRYTVQMHYDDGTPTDTVHIFVKGAPRDEMTEKIKERMEMLKDSAFEVDTCGVLYYEDYPDIYFKVE